MSKVLIVLDQVRRDWRLLPVSEQDPLLLSPERSLPDSS